MPRPWKLYQGPPRPSPARRSRGGQATTYALQQALVAYVLLHVDLLVAAPHHLSAPGITRTVARNALVESALIDLRALVGFLLADTRRLTDKNKHDVRPSWFTGGALWAPGGIRHKEALQGFFDAVSSHLAHATVSGAAHPGDWPIAEALLVVARDLGAFLDHLVASASATEAARFQSSSDRLPDVVATVEGLALHPYRPDRASADVRRARWLLRTQIGWPH